jgi:putative DNA primase/helicase
MTAAAVADAIRAYAARGWRPIALHNVPADGRACTCIDDRKAECRSQGKHPVHANWQKIILSPEHLIEVMLPVRPLMNVGIATGEHSKMWVLDVDDLAALQLLVDEHGPLPDTWRQRTGGGGLQFAFQLPDDFTPTNSAGRLPDGIDVRGDGGQIVAAPSISAKGAYVVEDDRDPVPAPGWLLDLVRPIARKLPAGNISRDLTGENLDRLQRYAATALAGKLDDIRQAGSGRNTLSWGKACDLIRLANAEWSGLDPHEVFEQWAAAVADHPQGVHVPDSEIYSIWRNAMKAAGDQAADPPPDTIGQPEVIDLPALPFDSISPPAGSTPGISRLPTPAEVEQLLLAVPDDLDRRARAREVPGMLFTLDDDELIPYRDVLKQAGHLTHADFWTIVKAERRRVAEAERRLRSEQLTADPTRYQLPMPEAPLPVARALQQRFAATGRRLRQWRGDWYQWQGTHWAMLSPSAVRSMVVKETEPAFYVHPEDGEKAWNPTSRSVSQVLDMLAHGVVYRDDLLDADTCIALANGVLDIGTRALYPHDPERFNLWSLPHAYDPAAAAPGWLAFLDQVMPDPESRLLLQQWFGYIISGRTDLQKILSLFGAKRSGKGTVLRVLEAIIGHENASPITLGQLAGQFGEQTLIGMGLATITDANWNIRDIDTAVEALKSISGEDRRPVARKNQVTWRGKLGVRFVILGNAEPKFNDPSGALVTRMLHINFTRSFAGVEEIGLTDRLLRELPGILNWALDGLASLNSGGRLVEPSASRRHAEALATSTNPVAAFAEDRCEQVDPLACVAVPLDVLYGAFRTWSVQQGVDHVPTLAWFSRTLGATFGDRIRVERTGPRGGRYRVVYGLDVLTPALFD